MSNGSSSDVPVTVTSPAPLLARQAPPPPAASSTPSASQRRVSETELLRGFRLRLEGIQSAQASEASLAQQDALAHSLRLAEVSGDLDIARARAALAERRNAVLEEALGRLESGLRSASADREAMLLQLVEARRFAATVAAALTVAMQRSAGMAQMGAGEAPPDLPLEGAVELAPSSSCDEPLLIPRVVLPPIPDVISGHDEVRHLRCLVSSLRRMLDAERRDAHAAKSRLRGELERRTQADLFLRGILDKGQRGVAAARATASDDASTTSSGVASPSAAEDPRCTGAGLPARPRASEGQSLLASLLAHEHVLAALRGVVFPASY